MSAPISSNVRDHVQVRFDHGPHRRPTVATCKVVERLGFVQDIGTWAAVVEHDGKEIMVVHHSMIRTLWRPWTPRDRVVTSPPASSMAGQR
jgi:hypothetical protein